MKTECIVISTRAKELLIRKFARPCFQDDSEFVVPGMWRLHISERMYARLHQARQDSESWSALIERVVSTGRV